MSFNHPLSRNKAGRSRDGFSLVEVLISIVILGVAVVGLTQGLTTALQSSKDSELHTTAAFLAAAQVELLRADGLVRDGETDGDCGDALPLYRWRRTISRTDLSGLHSVKVTIEHTRNGRMLYELETMLFETPDDEDSGKPNSRSPARDQRSRRAGA